ncbi:MAG: HD domain-containing phosphohydrolase [Gemmatimonadales bacterium]
MLTLKSLSFLRTRVARRILGLFMLCSLGPVIGLAAFSYSRVSRQLLADAESRLSEDSKNAGFGVMERLLQLDAELDRIVQGQVDPRIGDGGNADRRDYRPRFTGLLSVRPDGTLGMQAGLLHLPLPSLGVEERKRLNDGRSVLLVDTLAGRPRILLARRRIVAGEARVLWGQPAPSYLWGRLPTEEEAGTCVLDDSGHPLVCTGVSPEPLVRESGARHAAVSEWDANGERYVGATWTLFLKYEFGAPSWTIAVSQRRADILGPLDRFRRGFVLTGLLALVIVFMLSHMQIRRSMTPLEALEAGTHRVARRDFSEPVRVRSRDEFEILATSFNDMAGRLQRQFSALTAMNQIDRVVLSALRTEPIVQAVLTRALDVLRCEAVVVCLARVDDPSCWDVQAARLGRDGTATLTAHLLPAEMQELSDQREAIHTAGGEGIRTYLDLPVSVVGGIRQFLALPMRHISGLIGAIVLGFVHDRRIDPEDMVQARQLADQVTVAISNTRLVEELDALNWGALTALARTIDANSPWTAGHSERVTQVAVGIARALELPEPDIVRLHRGGLLHDIGKIGIPKSILDKAGPLTDEEMAVMRDHPSMGARILTPITAYRDLIPLVRHHHELLDGSGYPDGLKGDQIPQLVGILTVADVFDALVSERPYRGAWTGSAAADYLLERAGKQFDPAALAGFVRAIDSQDPFLDSYPRARVELAEWRKSAGNRIRVA